MISKFRPQRGSLCDSMASCVAVSTREQLVEHLQNEYPFLGPPCNSNVSLKHVGYDCRTGWDTYYVCILGQCVGMSDGTP